MWTRVHESLHSNVRCFYLPIRRSYNLKFLIVPFTLINEVQTINQYNFTTIYGWNQFGFNGFYVRPTCFKICVHNNIKAVHTILKVDRTYVKLIRLKPSLMSIGPKLVPILLTLETSKVSSRLKLENLILQRRGLRPSNPL